MTWIGYVQVWCPSDHSYCQEIGLPRRHFRHGEIRPPYWNPQKTVLKSEVFWISGKLVDFRSRIHPNLNYGSGEGKIWSTWRRILTDSSCHSTALPNSLQRGCFTVADRLVLGGRQDSIIRVSFFGSGARRSANNTYSPTFQSAPKLPYPTTIIVFRPL